MRSLSDAAYDHSSSAATHASARVTARLPAVSVACARKMRLPDAGAATSQIKKPSRSVSPLHNSPVPTRFVSLPFSYA
jgi:hypothetical protein